MQKNEHAFLKALRSKSNDRTSRRILRPFLAPLKSSSSLKVQQIFAKKFYVYECEEIEKVMREGLDAF